MQIWTVSLQGNIATKRQTQSLAHGLTQFLGDGNIQSFFPAAPHSPASLSGNSEVTWTDILSVKELANLGLQAPWPDIVISCRPEVAALALSIKKASAGNCKVIHIQNPNGYSGLYQFAPGAFDLILRQPQEHFAGDNAGNVLSSKLAVHGLTPAIIADFRAGACEISSRLRISNPLVVLVGGSDEHIKIGTKEYARFAEDMIQLATTYNGSIVVLTSRRTGEENIRILRESFARKPSIFLDNPAIRYTDALGMAEKIIVTAESLSMVAEALATGKPCSLYDFSALLQAHPLHEVFSKIMQEGDLATYPAWPVPKNQQPVDEIPELAKTICLKFQLGDEAPRF